MLWKRRFKLLSQNSASGMVLSNAVLFCLVMAFIVCFRYTRISCPFALVILSSVKSCVKHGNVLRDDVVLVMFLQFEVKSTP